MTRFLIILPIALTTVITVAQQSKEYDGVKAIRELHEGWLVVRLPGFEKKISAIDSLLNIPGLSDKAQRDLEREKANTLAEQDFIYKWYPVMFDSVYAFSGVAFIYTHETDLFQSGLLRARSASGESLIAIHDSVYFFATLQGISSDPFVFSTKDHQILIYPFPNRIGLPGFIFPGLFGPPVPEWIRSLGDGYSPIYRVYSHIHRVNRKLKGFYEKMYSAKIVKQMTWG